MKYLVIPAYILLSETDIYGMTITHRGDENIQSTQSSLVSWTKYQCQFRCKAYFYFAVKKFLYNEKDGTESQSFQLKQLINSEHMKDYIETEIIEFITLRDSFE